MSNDLPWAERVNMLSINPDAANRHDVARMAAELSEAAERERSLLGLLRQIINDLPRERGWLDPMVERNARAALSLRN